jgi:hypothetical protein
MAKTGRPPVSFEAAQYRAGHGTEQGGFSFRLA